MASRAGAVFRGTMHGLGFDSLLRHWNFSLTKPFRPHYGQGVYVVSNRTEYPEYFLEGKLAVV